MVLHLGSPARGPAFRVPLHLSEPHSLSGRHCWLSAQYPLSSPFSLTCYITPQKKRQHLPASFAARLGHVTQSRITRCWFLRDAQKGCLIKGDSFTGRNKNSYSSWNFRFSVLAPLLLWPLLHPFTSQAFTEHLLYTTKMDSMRS